MAKLIYSAIGSLDGYVEDEQGKFEWAAPDEEVLAPANVHAQLELLDERRFRSGVIYLNYRIEP
jgi:hypothetical protein